MLVLILLSRSLYCRRVWLTAIPVAAVKSAIKGSRLPVVSVHRKLTTAFLPTACVTGKAVAVGSAGTLVAPAGLVGATVAAVVAGTAVATGALVGAVVAGAAQA